MKKKEKTFDKIIIGFIPGIILPLISVYFFYLTQYVDMMDFEKFIKDVIKYQSVTKVLSVCLIANLAIFFLFLNTERNKSARGVLIATFTYAGFMLIYMFLL